jgi:hypothetical protein
MSEQFVPSVILVMGPNVPSYRPKRNQSDVAVALMCCDEPVVRIQGKVPFGRDIKYPAQGGELSFTQRRFLWTYAVTFRGTAILPIVEAAVEGGEMEDVSREVNTFLNAYVWKKFLLL